MRSVRPWVVALFVVFVAAPATASASEVVPSSFYGNAGIPRGLNATEVGNRFITSGSRIFLTVDTTSWPGADLSVEGVRVNNHGPGFVTVATLDEAPAPQTAGIPFNYLVVNQPSGTIGSLSYVTGSARIPAGQPNVGVSTSAAGAGSVILLTVDATSISGSAHLPALKINNKGGGFFTVTTADLSAAPSSGVPFNWMILNGSSIQAGSGRVPAGQPNVGLSTNAANNPSAVFLTTDATSIPGADVALPGVKVNNHGAGFFTVTTTRLTNAPSTGVPFDYLVVEPPGQWEEYGPTAWSGNDWTIAADPVDERIVYTGSSRGGLWKTTDGGQVWSEAWNQPETGIYRIAIDPRDRNSIYALDFFQQVWVSHDAANTWNKLASQPPLDSNDPYRGPLMTMAGDGTLWVCTDGGLAELPAGTTTWRRDDPVSTDRSCTDVQVGRDGAVYAAFRKSGVFRRPAGSATFVNIKPSSDPTNGRPVRLAIGQSTIVVNDDQHVYTNTLPTLGAWADRGQWCGGGQDGYSLSVAISPANDNHFVSFGNCGWMTTDLGAHHFPDNPDQGTPSDPANHDPTYTCPNNANVQVPCFNLKVGQDDHQAVFWDDQHVLLATDNGPRFSSNGGRDWGETESGFSRITDGPPISEFYNLSVSAADQFGRVYVSGNSQDHGAVAIAGRRAGFSCCGGESGLSVATNNPLNSADTTQSTFRYYGTDAGGGGLLGASPDLFLCTVNVPGPDYIAPSGLDENQFPAPAHSPCPHLATFAANVRTVATHPLNLDQALAGLDNGDIYRTVAGSNGARFERLLAGGAFGAAKKIAFTSTDVAYAGYANGRVEELDNPFVNPTAHPLAPTGSSKPVVAIVRRSGSPAELYVAQQDSVWKSTDDGGSWTNVTGPGTSGLGQNLNGLGIVGMALDTNHPFLYIATGVGYVGTVWRDTLPASLGNTWTNFGQGLPISVPITGIGVAANRALFISTVGRGIWWRRDVAAVPPNSGINRPARGSSRVGRRVSFVTLCKDPRNWKNIKVLEFRMARGHGPLDARRILFALQFKRGRFRLIDLRTGHVKSGRLGSHRSLRNRYVVVDLRHSRAVGIGHKKPRRTIRITWVIRFKRASRGRLQQYLQVTDTRGNTTSWDRVGSWRVRARRHR
jgi:hypothetical protein